jgi:hypothetical protein
MPSKKTMKRGTQNLTYRPFMTICHIHKVILSTTRTASFDEWKVGKWEYVGIEAASPRRAKADAVRIVATCQVEYCERGIAI